MIEHIHVKNILPSFWCRILKPHQNLRETFLYFFMRINTYQFLLSYCLEIEVQLLVNKINEIYYKYQFANNIQWKQEVI